METKIYLEVEVKILCGGLFQGVLTLLGRSFLWELVSGAPILMFELILNLAFSGFTVLSC